MNDNPEVQQGDSADKPSSRPERQPNLLNRWMELLLQLGLGESALRVATNVLLLLVVVGVVCVADSGIVAVGGGLRRGIHGGLR